MRSSRPLVGRRKGRRSPSLSPAPEENATGEGDATRDASAMTTALSGPQGRVEELLGAEELWNNHKKLIFFPFSSAATCTNRPLEIDQRNPHNSYTQLQWLATNGKLCKKQ
ncbi:hypothetical protein Taro_021342 [Colocasia esculenta]|uniref:Uncharacterized protein n=1 Tax=Colocasia esculenta TaxID=4460 RepID=A0A843UYR2_COLES|nr:hypothetical protein [Colocasia esculenta]